MWSRGYNTAAVTVLQSLLFSFLLSGCVLQPLQSPTNEQQSEQAAAQLELGLAYLQQERLELARQHLLKALQYTAPEREAWQKIHYGLALIDLRWGENTRSEYHFQQALSVARGDPDAENGYGVLLCRLGRIEEAALHFQRAINSPQYRTPEVAMNNQKACGEEQ